MPDRYKHMLISRLKESYYSLHDSRPADIDHLLELFKADFPDSVITTQCTQGFSTIMHTAQLRATAVFGVPPFEYVAHRVTREEAVLECLCAFKLDSIVNAPKMRCAICKEQAPQPDEFNCNDRWVTVDDAWFHSHRTAEGLSKFSCEVTPPEDLRRS